MLFKIFSTIYSRNCLINRINTFCTTSKHLLQTHYDVLNLKRDCTTKEIKDAFIKLSKQYHPDTTNGSGSPKKFVRILEAYNVLSKPNLRRDYDLGLITPRGGIKTTSPNPYYEYNDQYERVRRDPSFWENRDKSKDKYYEGRSYYGIKGVQKVSNQTIVAVCLLFATLGIFLQVILIRRSVTFKREIMMQRSIEAQETLNSVKRDAAKYGNEVQLQRLIERIEMNKLSRSGSSAPKD